MFSPDGSIPAGAATHNYKVEYLSNPGHLVGKRRVIVSVLWQETIEMILRQLTE